MRIAVEPDVDPDADVAELSPGSTLQEIDRAAGLSASQVADVAAGEIHRWADDVLARN